MDNSQTKKYFGASNSAEGFVNYFPEIFNADTCSRIYVVKGGPGTGKSRFMKDVAGAAEEKGMGVRYYYCSSDADSLDGIFIEELRVGFVDGTSPHIYEPSLAGAFEQIINLGEFWDERDLQRHRDTIGELSSKKSLAYKTAYAFLSAYGSLMRAAEQKTVGCVNRKKLGAAVKRWLHRLPSGERAVRSVALRSSIGMQGERSLQCYENDAELVFSVKDYHNTAHLILGAVAAEAASMRIPFRVSYDPIMSRRIDGVLLENCKIAFVTNADSEHIINAKRFVDTDAFKSVKDSVKTLESKAREMKLCALDEFESVRKYHFELEAIYAEAMDFKKKEQYTAEFIKKLL